MSRSKESAAYHVGHRSVTSSCQMARILTDGARWRRQTRLSSWMTRMNQWFYRNRNTPRDNTIRYLLGRPKRKALYTMSQKSRPSTHGCNFVKINRCSIFLPPEKNIKFPKNHLRPHLKHVATLHRWVKSSALLQARLTLVDRQESCRICWGLFSQIQPVNQFLQNQRWTAVCSVCSKISWYTIDCCT